MSKEGVLYYPILITLLFYVFGMLLIIGNYYYQIFKDRINKKER